MFVAACGTGGDPGAEAAPAAGQPSASSPAGGPATVPGGGSTPGTLSRDPSQGAGTPGSPAGGAGAGSAGASAGSLAPGASNLGSSAPHAIFVSPTMVVAKVNGTELQGVDLDRAFSASYQQAAQSGKVLSESEQRDLMTSLLKAMIDRELLRQQAVASGVTPDPKFVDQQYQTIHSRAPDEGDFQKVLKGSGYTTDSLRAEIAKRYVMDQYIQKISKAHADEIRTTDAEAQAIYDRQREAFNRPERVHVRHILRKVPPGATAEQKAAEKAKIEEAQARLKAGADFKEVARDYSVDGTSMNGGDLGFIAKGDTIPVFEDAAFALAPGATSGIVESQYGYHIIRCDEKSPAGIAPFSDVKTMIVQQSDEEKRDRIIQAEVDKLHTTAKIEILLKLPESGTAAAPSAAVPSAAPAPAGAAATPPAG